MSKEHSETRVSFAGELLDLGPEARDLKLVPIYEKDGPAEGLVKGFALHQHTDVPIVTLDGASIEFRCDYVVLDIRQTIQIRDTLIAMDLRLVDMEGNEIDE